MATLLANAASLYPATISLSSAVAEAPPADGVDRISALPDDILRNIVSRLPVPDGARTTAVAPRWRGIWRSTPIVLRDADLLRGSPSDDNNAARDAAFAAVGRILADHPGPFPKVHLTRFSFGSREREIEEWARLLAAKGVRELLLFDIDDSAHGRFQSLPADILRCASLQYLSLGYWTFPPPSTDVAFPHLKSAVMQNTSMTDQDLDHLLACSPVLQKLALTLSKSPQRIHLRSESLECMLVWMFVTEELSVVDAPCLQRLILCRVNAENERGAQRPMMVKIHRAPKLCVLGYLEPRVHQLQIGNILINNETKSSPSSIVPSVKILALKVNFGHLQEVKMLPSFLRCFPNVETLHIESSIIGVATPGNHAMFWQEVLPIECLKSHVKKIVMHKYQGTRYELEFLKFMVKVSRKLQDLQLVVTQEISSSPDKVSDVNCDLLLRSRAWTWAAEGCKVKLLATTDDEACTFSKASDLFINDPFLYT